ncbi:uncharacterized protein LOC107434886 isoform X2 [Ziziphus jujuba]|uniref:Uncharacterized protein LOC107434886 isoform X2 n=1 Tax=Ziziphus jujuba TaxID=326968 RepID=A0A6P4ASJ5_ZIZJJ|nr:uncharacterized protein LOC107434886 isoform X2 [Ziziphus jujuba]XP_048320220.1 uncharacterized protein LOC107434886 isoform X2 [Ziziphus jujuba var. spinosa]
MFTGQKLLNSNQQLHLSWICREQSHLGSIWVQKQLKDHPDELWEDGVRDYLSHASNIMEKFTDVVNWLKANGGKGENFPAAGSHTAEKKTKPETKNNEIKSFQEKTGFTPIAAGSSATSWSFGLLPNNHSSGGTFSNSQSSGGAFSTNQSSTGAFSNNQSSSGAFSNKQSSAELFPSNEGSAGVFPNNQSSAGIFSNSQSSVKFGGNQIFGAFSDSQRSRVSSDVQSSGLFPNNKTVQSTGFFSNNQTVQSSVLFSNNQTPFLFGNQNSGPKNRDASDDADDENELEPPSSPSVKKTEEKGVVVVHEVKCKLYVKSSDPVDKDAWKDKGTGRLSIKCQEGVSKGTKESKPTILVRNDVGKVLLNALLYPGIKTNSQKNSIVAIFHTAGDGDGNEGENNDSAVARTFLIRLKSEEDRNKLATAIQEYAPSS